MTTDARYAAAGVLLASLCCVSCGGESAPTAPASTVSPTVTTWTSLIGAGGSASRSIVTSQAGSVTITLQSAPVPLDIAVGVPGASGAGCQAAVSARATPTDGPPLSVGVEQGTYCVLVFDVERSLNEIPFTLQIVYP